MTTSLQFLYTQTLYTRFITSFEKKKKHDEGVVSRLCFFLHQWYQCYRYSITYLVSIKQQCLWLTIWKRRQFISCFPIGYREISVKIFFDLTLVAPMKIPIFMFLLCRLIARASQPDGNMTSFTLYFSRFT